MKTFPHWHTAAALYLAIASMPAPALAEQPKRMPANAVCMARNANTPDRRLVVLPVPAARQTEMQARGFIPYSCDELPDFDRYREDTCTSARQIPRLMQQLLQHDKGISPTEMCDLANEIANQ